MNNDEIYQFLKRGTFTGKVATVRADGRPHLAPVWFVLDDENKDLVFTTGNSSQKAKNILRDPRVSISVDNQTPLYSFVIVDGVAEISDQSSELLIWATKIAERYMGRNNAEVYGKRNSTEGEILVRVSPLGFLVKMMLRHRGSKATYGSYHPHLVESLFNVTPNDVSLHY